MLNGIAPILIFQIPKLLPLPALSSLGGIPVLKGLSVPGIPIPLYLDEKLTGIYVVDETGGLTVDTSAQYNQVTKKTEFDQRGVENTITVSMLANPDSVVLGAIIAFLDTIFQQLVEVEYSVSYINGSTLILGGLIAGFNKQVGSDDNLIRLTLHLQKKDQATPATPDPGLKVASKVAGTAAGTGG